MESNKSFNVINDPSSLASIVTVGMPGQATVTIVDDDSKWCLLFVMLAS